MSDKTVRILTANCRYVGTRNTADTYDGVVVDVVLDYLKDAPIAQVRMSDAKALELAEKLVRAVRYHQDGTQ
jgi:hypothetical protein